VRTVARLANLTLSPDEEEALARDLARILAYVAELETVDTSAVDAAVPRDAGALRDDAPTPGLSREDALRAAPLVADGAFVVPPFVD
jgi:aspartyl-tRNA(Asn)/glutamyl-tRNA(Gln) amidotransferase subunit C